MNAQSLAKLLQATEVEAGLWMAQCPAHIDTVPSLSIQESTIGLVALQCSMRCKRDEILGALGLVPRALLANVPASAGQVAAIRAYRKDRMEAEQGWRQFRRNLWDQVRADESTVEELVKKLARAPGNAALAEALHNARCQLRESELIAQDQERLPNRRSWWMTIAD